MMNAICPSFRPPKSRNFFTKNPNDRTTILLELLPAHSYVSTSFQYPGFSSIGEKSIKNVEENDEFVNNTDRISLFEGNIKFDNKMKDNQIDFLNNSELDRNTNCFRISSNSSPRSNATYKNNVSILTPNSQTYPEYNENNVDTLVQNVIHTENEGSNISTNSTDPRKNNVNVNYLPHSLSSMLQRPSKNYLSQPIASVIRNDNNKSSASNYDSSHTVESLANNTSNLRRKHSTRSNTSENSESSSNQNAKRSRSSTSSFPSQIPKGGDASPQCDEYAGIQAFSRNAGINAESLLAFLQKCLHCDCLSFSFIWYHHQSNHNMSSNVTPAIRIQLAYRPVLGALFVLSNELEVAYFLPLSQTNNANPNDWKPNYEESFKSFKLQLQCDTSLEDRWNILFQILSHSLTKKLLFHSLLLYLPLLSTLENIRTSSSSSTLLSLKEFSHKYHLMCNLFDIKLAAHLLDSNLEESQLELPTLLMSQSERLPVLHSDTTRQTLPFGRVTSVLYHTYQEIKQLFPLYSNYSKKLSEMNSLTVFQTLEIPLVQILAEMELRGIEVSLQVMNKMKSDVTDEIHRITQLAYQSAGHSFNLASSEQIAGILFHELKLPMPALTPKQKHASTSEEELLRLVALHPIVQLILDYRYLAKLLGTYLDGMRPYLYSLSHHVPLPDTSSTTPSTTTNTIINRDDPNLMDYYLQNTNSTTSNNNVHHTSSTSTTLPITPVHIHANWNQMATRTGRLSCSKPNLQNIPKYLTSSTSTTRITINARNLFRASPRCILISSDYSQIEMRILAHICDDSEMKQLFASQSGDIYTHLAGMILSKDLSFVTSIERERAKVICLGVIYGMGPTAAAEKLQISVTAVNKITQSFFQKFRAVKSWLQQTKESAKSNGYVKTLLGRRRFLPDINNDNNSLRSYAERQAVNTVIQGTAAEVLKYAMLIVHKEIQDNWDTRNNGSSPKLLLQIHDELIFEVQDTPSSVNRFVRMLSSCMEERTKEGLQLTVPLVVNIQTGFYWGNMTTYGK